MSSIELDELSESLHGSPYSLPDNASSLESLALMQAKAKTLESRCLQVRQSLAEQMRGRISRSMRVSEIYESNAIEGKTATLAETLAIVSDRSLFDARQVMAEYTLTEAMRDDPKVHDVVGLATARILVDQYVANQERPLSESDLRDMHRMIMAGAWDAGRYKAYVNRIEGSIHTPLPPSDVPAAMNQLVHWLRETPAPLVWKSAVGHAWLTHIHPFDDGNGRIARLLANYVLGEGSFPPLIVKSGVERPRYINALSHSDEAGDVSRLVRLFVRVLNRGIVLMEDPKFALNLFDLDLKKRETDLYARWLQVADAFFVEVAGHLITRRRAIDRIASPSASDFEFLRRRSSSGNGWFARTSAAEDGRDILIWIGYVSDQSMRAIADDQIFPSFFMGERDLNPKAYHPYRQSVLDREPQFDELTIIADEEVVMLRRGATVRKVNLKNGAELYAAAITNYLEEMDRSPQQPFGWPLYSN